MLIFYALIYIRIKVILVLVIIKNREGENKLNTYFLLYKNHLFFHSFIYFKSSPEEVFIDFRGIGREREADRH